ncbi:MAG: DEAD/DEAH box helicase [Holophagales bacterium]|nr:DEAD/DEAH box helicase [Holophagales bacterium]
MSDAPDSPPTSEVSDASDSIDGGFAALGLDPRLLTALSTLGYEEPTPIQRQAIPPLLAKRDLLAQAATGTGKTAAFALPMLDRLVREGGDRKAVFGLVLVPTRELAMQVAEAVHRYGRGTGVRVLAVYGGSSMGLQLRELARGVDVVVATPGRALDHVKRGTLNLSGVKLVVLDEADEMLDMGFSEDLEAILDATPAGHPMALFSATFPARIAGLAGRRLSSPVELRLGAARDGAGAKDDGGVKVKQTAYVVPRAHKLAALSRILDLEDPTSAIVFCRTRTEVDEISEKLNARGRRAEALHGGFTQDQRDRVMKRFRSGAADLLIATDVAARGLDVEQISHVFNYDVPSEAEAYVHRIGRTARAGRAGTAITLFEPREQWLLANVERLTKKKIERATVPTVADLRARRLELTRASLRETILGGGLETFRVAVDSLADEFDILDVAAAGVKLAHEAAGSPGEEEEIPAIPVPQDRPRFVPRAETGGMTRPVRRTPRLPGAVSLFIGAGRDAGIRPADLFGAITNEAKLPSRAIGAIEIADRFSLVEVPGESADAVIEALRKTTVRGRKVMVRRERPAPPRR